MVKKSLCILAVAGAVLASIPAECFAWGRAEVDAACEAMNATYSTSSQRCVCKPGFTESNNACVRNGGSSGGSAGSNYDYGAQQRAQEAAAAESRRIYEQKQREDDERRQREEEEAQAEFIRQRDATVLRGSGGLSGSTGMRITPNAPGATELRGSKIDTGIRDIKRGPASSAPGGTNAAWKQLNCSAAISVFALNALTGTDKPDYDEFRNLTGEALNALTGAQMGVECPKTPSVPSAYGKGGTERVAADYKALIERMMKTGEDLSKVRAKRKEALDRLVEIKKAIADPKEKSELDKLRAVQAKINQIQDEKYAPKKDAQGKINAANQREAEELKKGAMAEALAALRAAESVYGSATKHESEDLRKLKVMKEAADGIGSFRAETLKKLEHLDLGGGL